MVKIILMAHGDMARSMLDTASEICSFSLEGVSVFSVSGRVDLEEISGKIKDIIDPSSGTLILADVFGGTSCNMAAALTHGMDNVSVICGFNLNMLLAALNYRGILPPSALAKKVLEDGQRSIINVTEKLK